MYFFLNSSEKTDKTYNSFCTNKCIREAVDGKLQCKCGENTAAFDWVWQDQPSTNIKLSNEGRDVLFHPVYSSGTAAVRGQIPFQQNYHYYWEIKVISKLYGTDVMIGVGTAKVVYEDWQYKFCSLLGIDSESWGYSYQGSIQHNKLRRKYGSPFGLGSIIGVHLDMCNGTLEYFLNRKSIGIAFKDLKEEELYPMVCSTAAKSSIRITCCMSQESSLQMMCLRHIMSHSSLYNEYRNIPGLSRLYDKQLSWIQPQLPKEVDEKKRMAELDEDVALSLVDPSYMNKNKKFRAIRLISYLCGLEKIQNDSDSEVHDFCDLDLATTNRQHKDDTDRPSTSGKSHYTPDKAECSKPLSVCVMCLSKTHNTVDCALLYSRLDDSDTDTETPGLSNIL